jgi:hypothetical protein
MRGYANFARRKSDVDEIWAVSSPCFGGRGARTAAVIWPRNDPIHIRQERARRVVLPYFSKPVSVCCLHRGTHLTTTAVLDSTGKSEFP